MITLSELHSGAVKSATPTQEIAKIDRLAGMLFTLDWNAEAAREAASIPAQLETTGQKIGAYNTLIAGHARSTSLTLITNNTSEFRRVTDLGVEDWRARSRHNESNDV